MKINKQQKPRTPPTECVAIPIRYKNKRSRNVLFAMFIFIYFIISQDLRN